MRILLINQTFHPDAAATAQLLTDLARDLVAQGHQVAVLTSQRGYVEPDAIYPRHEQVDGIEVMRVPPVMLNRRRRSTRLLDALLTNAAFAWRMLWLPRFDRVVALTSPPLVAWAAQKLARMHGSPFTYWVMDLNPDQAVVAGWFHANAPWTRFLQQALCTTLRHSDRVVVLDTYMRHRVMAKGSPSTRIEVHPPLSASSVLPELPAQSNPFRVRYGLQDKFVVMYSGNHSICHPVETLLETARVLRHEPDIVFAFIGGGPRMPEVTRYRDEHRLENMLVLPYQDRAELKFSLSAADLHVVLMGDPYVGIVHPCKIYPILQLGLPFLYIGPAASPIGDMVTQRAVGCRVGHGDVNGAVNAIQSLRSVGQQESEARAQRSPALYQEFASLDLTRAIGVGVELPSARPIPEPVCVAPPSP
ncbi:MAG: glycosyltransferase family 4 protein [Candidatus Xenobia bacterium]